MESKFEQYLLNNGWKKHRWTENGLVPETKGRHEISTMSNIDYRYIKGDRVISYGLFSAGFPPTLVSPQPLINVIDGNRILLNPIENYYIDTLLANEPFDELLEAMFERKYKYIFNGRNSYAKWKH